MWDKWRKISLFWDLLLAQLPDCIFSIWEELYAAFMNKAFNDTSECISNFVICCNTVVTLETTLIFQQLLHSQPFFSTERRESVLQYGSAVGGCTKLCHPSPHRPLPEVHARTRTPMWVGWRTHACTWCVHTPTGEKTHTLTQVLSGITLNKWSIHLSSRSVSSVNRCCLMSSSSTPNRQ